MVAGSLGAVNASAAASADLSVTKSGTATAKPGAQFDYQLVWTNNGPDAAANVKMTDTLPASVSFVSASFGPGGPPTSCGLGQTINCSTTTLANGTSVTLIVTVKVDPAAADATVISNTASVSADTLDPNTANNSATTNTTVVAVTCGSAKLLVGDKALAQSTTDDDTSGMAEAFQATATASGTATVVCLYLAPTNAATKLVGGIYADNGSNKPGALLAQGTNSGPLVNAAWNTVQVPSVPLAAGTKYWITVLSPLGFGTLRFLDHCCTFQSYSPSSPSENSKQLTLTTLPAAWTSGKRWPRDGHILGWSGG